MPRSAAEVCQVWTHLEPSGYSGLPQLGLNTVTLSTNGDKAYDCTITFTDSAGNVASALSLTQFTVDTTAAAATETTAPTAMHYCGHVPNDDDTITATGQGVCSLTDNSGDLSACEVKCDGCPECVGFLLQPDTMCYFYQQLTAASSVSYSTSENPEGPNYYINARSDLCSDPTGDLSA